MMTMNGSLHDSDIDVVGDEDGDDDMIINK